MSEFVMSREQLNYCTCSAGSVCETCMQVLADSKWTAGKGFHDAKQAWLKEGSSLITQLACDSKISSYILSEDVRPVVSARKMTFDILMKAFFLSRKIYSDSIISGDPQSAYEQNEATLICYAAGILMRREKLILTTTNGIAKFFNALYDTVCEKIPDKKNPSYLILINAYIARLINENFVQEAFVQFKKYYGYVNRFVKYHGYEYRSLKEYDLHGLNFETAFIASVFIIAQCASTTFYLPFFIVGNRGNAAVRSGVEKALALFDIKAEFQSDQQNLAFGIVAPDPLSYRTAIDRIRENLAQLALASVETRKKPEATFSGLTAQTDEAIISFTIEAERLKLSYFQQAENALQNTLENYDRVIKRFARLAAEHAMRKESERSLLNDHALNSMINCYEEHERQLKDFRTISNIFLKNILIAQRVMRDALALLEKNMIENTKSVFDLAYRNTFHALQDLSYDWNLLNVRVKTQITERLSFLCFEKNARSEIVSKMENDFQILLKTFLDQEKQIQSSPKELEWKANAFFVIQYKQDLIVHYETLNRGIILNDFFTQYSKFLPSIKKSNDKDLSVTLRYMIPLFYNFIWYMEVIAMVICALPMTIYLSSEKGLEPGRLADILVILKGYFSGNHNVNTLLICFNTFDAMIQKKNWLSEIQRDVTRRFFSSKTETISTIMGLIVLACSPFQIVSTTTFNDMLNDTVHDPIGIGASIFLNNVFYSMMNAVVMVMFGGVSFVIQRRTSVAQSGMFAQPASKADDPILSLLPTAPK